MWHLGAPVLQQGCQLCIDGRGGGNRYGGFKDNEDDIYFVIKSRSPSALIIVYYLVVSNTYELKDEVSSGSQLVELTWSMKTIMMWMLSLIKKAEEGKRV